MTALRCVLLLFISSVFFNHVLSAQPDSSRIKKSIEVNNYANNTGLNITACFILNFKKHSFYLGPKFPISKFDDASIGLNFGYIFNPNKISQIVDVYFYYDFQLHKETGVYYSAPDILSVGKATAFHNTIGYGLMINLLRRLYINHSIAGGIKNFFIDNGNSGVSYAFVFKLGVGCKLK